MAEYLSPGVYIEEQDFRSSTIEGVSTTTTGFIGPCLWGPVANATLVTSFEEFRSLFGGLEPLEYGDIGRTTNYLAFGVRSFFDNGGKRCYISRIADSAATAAQDLTTSSGADVCSFEARYPGRRGNVQLNVWIARGSDLGTELNGLQRGDVVELATSPITEEFATGVSTAALRIVDFTETGELQLLDSGSTHTPPTASEVHAYKLTVTIEVVGSGSGERYTGLSVHPRSLASMERILRTEDETRGIEPPYDRTATIWFNAPNSLDDSEALDLLAELSDASRTDGSPFVIALNGTTGTDGDQPAEAFYEPTADGLLALEEMEDIALVAAPAAWNLGVNARQAVRNSLITHCETIQYRFAILADGREVDNAGIRSARAKHDTTYAALYYPWVVVTDPFGASGETIELPPDGFVAGICARSDIENGVHKAPANEVVRGALRFNRNVTTGQQDVLNPEGINCLRYFEGRGYLVWGARTMSSDPLWKYVNVRRLFIFLEHSIDRATQWAVFEPNNETLWLRIRLTIEAFLRNVHATGALLGSTPKDAFFVKCDRSTMSLSDLDNGRLVCLVGVAPTRPAEFVIFRIGQWTAEASLI